MCLHRGQAEVEGLEDQLHEKKVEASFTMKLKEFLAKKGFDPQMGARPMSRLIQDTIRKALAESKNTVAVELLLDVGSEPAAAELHDVVVLTLAADDEVAGNYQPERGVVDPDVALRRGIAGEVHLQAPAGDVLHAGAGDRPGRTETFGMIHHVEGARRLEEAVGVEVDGAVDGVEVLDRRGI